MRAVLRILLPAVLLAIPALSGPAAGAEWAPAKGPLMTQWAKDVSPEKAMPEYPRPTMVRQDWQNLNGLWQYAIRPLDEAQPKDFDGQILVPYPVESALSGVMKTVSEKERLWYRRTFETPKGWAGKRVLLHFGAVDWDATVTVNGKEAGNHKGGYDAFTFDVTDALKKDGPQELVVSVFDPTNAGSQPRGKQVHKPGGIMYTATTGIWQTAWLEPVPEARIASLKIVPDVDGKCLRLTVAAAGPGDAATLDVAAVAADAGKDAGKAAGKAGAEIRIPLADAKLWSPDTPFLYDLKVELSQGGKVVDSVTSYFGMRKIALGKDEQGIVRMMLNGKFVFQVGPLDQGFWPDGLYAAATDAALKYDVEITRKLGFNMARKHVKVEPERWYYWCDKLGLLVWQDMPAGDNKTPESKKQFEQELRRLVEGRGNHPSIIMWVVFNEGWGQHDTERLTGWVKELDPSRLANNASGWTDKKVGDVMDIHSYPAPKCPPAEPARAACLGEFGGLGLAVEGHMWKKENWGYRGMASPDELTRVYETFLQSIYKMKDSPGLCAVVYTQTTDVEVECNGLLTYDRAIVKPDLERIAAVNRGDFSRVPPPPIVKTVIPTSEESGLEWRFTTDKPADGWMKPDFDDSAWKKGPGGFGTKNTPGATVRTEWKTPDIWIRREVALPEGKFTDLQLRIHHDEDATVYINGVEAAKFGQYTSAYEEKPLNAAGKTALKAGKNVIAVQCHQTGGGQYIDVGVADVIPAPKK